MHIEPGLLAPAKIAAANVAAMALLAIHTPALLRKPALWLRTALAALFFSVFMEAFHLPVGPSELHFVGAMPIYLSLGLLPTLFGFAIGLLLQGLLFEPQDLIHLGVNALSLMVPLLAVHVAMGKRLQQMSVRQILKLDAAYYSGVTLMVAFWLAFSHEATAFADWALFASSYLGVVALEPLLTVLIVRGIRVLTARSPAWGRACLDERFHAA